jgi:hypothetical protein
MTERHLNSITLTLKIFDGQPFGGARLLEAYSLSIGSGERAEPDEITDELISLIGDRPYLLDQTYHATEWGASGAGLDILLQVPSAILSGYLLWDKISRKLDSRKKGELTNMNADLPAAVSYITDTLQVPEVDVQVIEVDDNDKRLRVIVNTPVGQYELKADKDSARTRLKNIPEPSQDDA